LPEKNRNFFGNIPRKSNFLTRIHDPPRFQTRLTPLYAGIDDPNIARLIAIQRRYTNGCLLV